MDIKKIKQNRLNELYSPYQKCTACPLGFLGRKNVVFGEGNPNATFIIIGEGPGKEEDTLNRPFIGRSGKLLDTILEKASFKREELYIANVVKCRPPENRKPLKTESFTCKNLLLFKQIQIISPRLICTLGASALEALIEQPVNMTTMRGTIIQHNSMTILPTYHPAYILRNRRELENFTKDFELAQKFLTSIAQ